MHRNEMDKLLAAQGCTSKPIYSQGRATIIEGYILVSPRGKTTRAMVNLRTGQIDATAVTAWLDGIAFAEAKRNRWAV
jgi:hypothetical protein